MFLGLEQRSHIHPQPFFFRFGLCQIVSSGSGRNGIICAAFLLVTSGDLLSRFVQVPLGTTDALAAASSGVETFLSLSARHAQDRASR